MSETSDPSESKDTEPVSGLGLECVKGVGRSDTKTTHLNFGGGVERRRVRREVGRSREEEKQRTRGVGTPEGVGCGKGKGPAEKGVG